MKFEIAPSTPLWKIPAMRPPPGAVSNFDNPDTNVGALKVLNALFPSFALIMVAIRLYARLIATGDQRFGWDDGFCIFAMAGSTVHTVLQYLSINYGYGRHLWDIRAFTLTPEHLRIQTLNDEVYIITIFLIKISILFLYTRFFGVYQRSRRLVNVGFIANTIISIPYLAVSITRTVECNGLRALHNSLCLTHAVSTTVTVFGIFNTIMDYYTLIIPINRVIKLNVDKKRKIGLLLVFLTGLGACVMSTVRLIIVIINFNSADVMWNAAKISPFTIVEINLAIMCNCMIFIPATVRRIRGQSEKNSSTSSPQACEPKNGNGYYAMDKSLATSRQGSKDENKMDPAIKTYSVA